MQKRYVYILLALVLILAGCKAEPAAPATLPTTAPPPVETVAPTETTIPIETAAPTETVTPTETTLPAQTLPVAETDPPTTEATQAPTPTEEAIREVPYLQRILRCDQSIYSGPGYDYGFVATVRKQGTYTIVEESVDREGILWGRLKSGIGWVDLTEIQSGNYASDLISANYADEDLVRNGAYHHYSTNNDYCIPIAFYAYGTLWEVSLFDMQFDAEGYVLGTELLTIPEMTEEKPLVAELDFPGDMSTYGIRFADELGNIHVYYIYISGRNGALILATE